MCKCDKCGADVCKYCGKACKESCDKARIDALERKVKELESRPPVVINTPPLRFGPPGTRTYGPMERPRFWEVPTCGDVIEPSLTIAMKHLL